MPFEPITSVRRNSKNGTQPRYSHVIAKGVRRLALHFPRPMLEQVKGGPRFWRLDLDTTAKRGRLTGFLQDDGHGATRPQPTHGKPTLTFSWIADKALDKSFPHKKATLPLGNPVVTSLGIEFDLPA